MTTLASKSSITMFEHCRPRERREMTAEGVRGEPLAPERRKLLMLIAAGSVVMAGEPSARRIDCKTEEVYVTDDLGRIITDDLGRGITTGRERKCEIDAGKIRIPLPALSEPI
jgi:hypothetical protein